MNNVSSYETNNTFINTIQELIKGMQQTEECRRSKAISEAITFLSNKIKNMETNNKELRKINSNLQQDVLLYKNECNKYLQNLNLQREEFEDSQFALINKIEAFNSINQTLENNIRVLEQRDNEQKKDMREQQHQKEEKFKSIIGEYKFTCEQLRKENQILSEKIEILLKNEDYHKNLIRELEKQHSIELKTLQDRELCLTKKLKEYEVLLFKIDLENQNYRECINTVTKKVGNISINLPKFNLLNELNALKTEVLPSNITEKNTIQKDEAVVKLSTVDTNQSSFIPIEEMNIEEIAAEIKKTENTLKSYSHTLKTQELNSEENEKENFNSEKNNEFQEFMNILEEKAEYLVHLKKRYNFLYKQLNNIN